MKRPLLAACLVPLIVGCTPTGVSGTGEVTSPVPAAVPASLADTRWRLLEFQSMDDATGTVRPDDPSAYRMQLNADGTVAMRLNCNSATGSWSAEPAGDGRSGHFEFGLLAMTQALCLEPSMDAMIAAQLADIRSYLLKNGNLYLSLMVDGGIVAWEPDDAGSQASIPYRSPDEGGPRNWELTVRAQLLEQPSKNATVVATYDSGTLLDNLGCESIAGVTWCDVQPFGGGPRGYVSSSALKPAVSPDGAVATGADDSAYRAGQGDFDATGQVPCARYAGQPMTRCDYGVARAGGGFATVVVTQPDGMKRAIYFRLGTAVGADTSQADGYPEFSAGKESDLHLIRIGEERYEIPDAVIFGG